MRWKINLTRMICFWMRKTYTAKTSTGDFKVTTLENSLLSQQVVTSKGIPVPYSNLQLNPYPNTQLDLFCRDNLSFQCTTPSTRLTNSMCGSQYPAYSSTWERYWLQSSSVYQCAEDHEAPGLQNSTVYKHSSFLKKDELGHMSPVHNMLVKNFCIEVHPLWWPLKQSLYMFRVMRKESPNIYTRIGVKSNLKEWFS